MSKKSVCGAMCVCSSVEGGQFCFCFFGNEVRAHMTGCSDMWCISWQQQQFVERSGTSLLTHQMSPASLILYANVARDLRGPCFCFHWERSYWLGSLLNTLLGVSHSGNKVVVSKGSVIEFNMFQSYFQLLNLLLVVHSCLRNYPYV